MALPGVGPKRWPAGTVVTVTGLKNAAQHNGKRGTVRTFSEEKGRYVVRLDDGEAIRLKPDNALLEEMPPEESLLGGGGEDSSSSSLLGGDGDGEGRGPLGGLAMPGAKEAAAAAARPTGGSGILIEVVKRYLKHVS